MSNTRIINAPEIDVLALGSGNHGVQIRIEWSPGSAEEIDTGRHEQQRTASAGRGPTLQPVDHSEIRAGANAEPPERDPQCFSGKRMVGRKILRDVYLRVRRVGDRHCGIWRLRHNELSQLIPL